MTKEFLHDDPLPASFTACPWCPASGPPNFMNGHMKRHEDENAIAQMVALQGRIQDWNICTEIADERVRQDDKWGEQNHPDGTGTTWIEDLMPFAWREDRAAHIALLAKAQCQREARTGRPTWRGIALEEIAEAFAETDPELLRAELIQAAAVLVNWIGALDRRKKQMTETVIPVSKWEHCGDINPHVTHTYDVSEQGVPTHCLGSPWTKQNDDQN